MQFLKQASCEACKIGAPLVTEKEKEEFLPQIPEWRIVEVAGEERLVRRYTFKNFLQALAFTNRVAEIAEEAGHHPALLTEWGSVEVSWWSHKIKGLHKNDFIMAAKTDALFNT
ncbi:MAG: 4a-hydroxytetrahydrobiopterin dehydratase [Desulfurivibrionaceae bacterium]|nr:4a-hydroxytetrahydrobiopterin dehydratase [Desulfurivibrionaceae bacterium]